MGRITFVDLASVSDKKDKSLQRNSLEKAANNHNLLSLSQLDLVVNSLISKTDKKILIPYHNSKLTKCLKDAIGGNSNTLCMLFCSQHKLHIEQTIKTFKFASAISNVKNKPVINMQSAEEALEEEDFKYNILLNKIDEKLKKSDDF